MTRNLIHPEAAAEAALYSTASLVGGNAVMVHSQGQPVYTPNLPHKALAPTTDYAATQHLSQPLYRLNIEKCSQC